MSKINLAPDASGTGIFTIASPDSNTNRTLTLPDDTGTIVTNSGNQAGSFTTLNTSGAVVFNDAGADVDFRVEGDTNANLLFVDASTDRVGIGTSSPSNKLHIAGSTRISDVSAGSAALFIPAGDITSDVSSGSFAVGNYGDASSELRLSTRGFTAFRTGATDGTNGSERMRITSAGSVGIGTGSPNATFEVAGTMMLASGVHSWINSVGAAPNAAATNYAEYGHSVTGRGISSGGSINASGSDYAEYMLKAGDFELAKGDICGVNSEGNLTNVFEDSVAFLVKSTNPSYVGGDTWAKSVGQAPKKPFQKTAEVDEEGNETQAAETDEDFAARVAQYESDLAEFEAKLEAERQKVDRMAFSGQVPVNVTGATAGQYIVPVESNGGITGVAVNEADMTLAQYMKAVGKVIAIEDDGRARIIVKVA